MAVSKIGRQTIAIAATGTSFTYSLIHVGVLTRYLLELPIIAGAPTVTLSLVDANSKTIFTGAAHQSSASAVTVFSIPIDVEIDGIYTVTLTLTGAVGGSGVTVYNTFWIR